MGSKIFDCVTFFNENFILNARFEILSHVVDYFVVCESIYDHRGQKKKLNFHLLNQKYKSKIIYIVLEDKFESDDLWINQAQQREYIFNGFLYREIQVKIDSDEGRIVKGTDCETIDDIQLSGKLEENTEKLLIKIIEDYKKEVN